MDEDIKEFFLSMADELRTAPEAPSDLLLRRVRRRRLRTVGAAFLALAVASGGTIGAIRAFGANRPAPAQGACSRGWTAPENPATKLNGGLMAASGSSPDDVWAVGSVIGSFPKAGHPIVQHWDGERWSLVRTPDLPAAGLSGVAAVSVADVWAVGDRWSGGTLVEHWDGTRWSVVPSPNLIAGPRWGNGLSAIAASSATDIWAVGDAANGRTSRPLIERWDGSSWTLVPAPDVNSTSSYLSDVAVVSPDDVWAVGSSWTGHVWQTLTIHWDGSAWAVVPSPNSDRRVTGLSGVVGLSTDDVWAVGSSSKLSRETVRPIVMHWDGTAWSWFGELPGGLPYGLEAVDAVGPNDVWAADKGITYAYALHWDGHRWTLVAPLRGPIKGGRLTGIVAFPSGEAVAVGSRSVETGESPLAVELCSSAASEPRG